MAPVAPTLHTFFSSVNSAGALQPTQPTLNDISGVTASFTGSIDNGSGAAGTTLAVTAVASGKLVPGQTVNGTGVTPGTQIVSQTLGPVGGTGAYVVNLSQLVVSTPTLTGVYNSLVLAAGGGLSPYLGTSCTLPQFMNALSLTGAATCNTPTVTFGTTPVTGVLPGANGGTNAANTGKTLTLAANFTTTGAGPATLAFPGTAAVYTHPPTSDTLVGRASTDTLTNKSIDASEINSGHFVTAQQVNLNSAPFPTALATGTTFGGLAADGNSTQISFVSAAAGPIVRLYRANNTIAAPAPPVPGDALGQHSYGGWDTSAWSAASVRLRAVSTDTWSTSAHGTQYEIAATPPGSITLQTEAVFQNGLGLGAGSPKGVGTANAPNGFYEGNFVLTLGGSLVTSGPVSTTGAGPTTLAFPGSAATYTFPTGGGTLVTSATATTFTQPQKINTNTSAFPAIASPTLGLLASDSTPTTESLVSSATPSQFRLFRTDGTIGSPTPLAANDVIGNLTWNGWDGAAWSNPSARIQGIATEPWSPSSHGTQYQIWSTPSGSNTMQLEAVMQNGLALDAGTPQGIGTVNATSGFYVGSTAVVSSARGGNFTSLLVNNNTTPTMPILSPAVANLAAADGVGTGVNLVSSGDNPIIRMYRVNNSVASPTPPAANDILGTINIGGFDGSVYSASATRFNVVATEAWNTTSHGSSYAIYSTPNGSAAGQLELMLHSGVASGSGAPKGVGTVNAPAGFYVGSTNVISSLGAGNFPGGLSATLGTTGTAVASLCIDASNNVFKKTTSGACI